MKIVNILATAVKETDKARSPLAMNVNIFDVGPPGQADKSIMPMAIVGVSSNNVANAKPINGKIRIWQQRPMMIAFGNLNTLLKSYRVSDSPIPNIIIIKEMASMIPAVEFMD